MIYLKIFRPISTKPTTSLPSQHPRRLRATPNNNSPQQLPPAGLRHSAPHRGSSPTRSLPTTRTATNTTANVRSPSRQSPLRQLESPSKLPPATAVSPPAGLPPAPGESAADHSRLRESAEPGSGQLRAGQRSVPALFRAP